ncbi:DUF1492 domain-containing protein [Carnobacterium maltaromaticum]|uniref:DUF1492 domain-containing protein n=1 Tax=Carnobacterium maltaromaticum TaxID=2751 RepID=UPI00026C8E30|nr:DUF1492 domain-containing protein [Carnobacterium maltaromaticum]
MGEVYVKQQSKKLVDERLRNIPKLTAMVKLSERVIAEPALKKRLEEAKLELETIKATISSLPDELQKDILTKRYIVQNKYETDIQVYMELNMSESYYYRLKKDAYELLSFLWGF